MDLSQFSDSVIQEHRSAALFEFVQKHIRDEDLQPLLEHLVLILTALRKANLPEDVLGSYEEAAFSYLLRASSMQNFSTFIDSMEQTPLRKGLSHSEVAVLRGLSKEQLFALPQARRGTFELSSLDTP